jgi:hypothetical protein
MTEPTKNLPADAVIVGIVDSAVFAGKTFYQSGDETAAKTQRAQR